MAAPNIRDEDAPRYDPVTAWFTRHPSPAEPWIALEPWRAEDRRQRREEERKLRQNTVEDHISADEIRDVMHIRSDPRVYITLVYHLARGRGVGTTVGIEGEDHIIVARVPSPSRDVWSDRPTAHEVTVEAIAIRQAFRNACVQYPDAVLPFRSVQGPIRVLAWPSSSSRNWYAYLCVPVESMQAPQSKPIPVPTEEGPSPKKQRGRFQNLEL